LPKWDIFIDVITLTIYHPSILKLHEIKVMHMNVLIQTTLLDQKTFNAQDYQFLSRQSSMKSS